MKDISPLSSPRLLEAAMPSDWVPSRRARLINDTGCRVCQGRRHIQPTPHWHLLFGIREAALTSLLSLHPETTLPAVTVPRRHWCPSGIVWVFPPPNTQTSLHTLIDVVWLFISIRLLATDGILTASLYTRTLVPLPHWLTLSSSKVTPSPYWLFHLSKEIDVILRNKTEQLFWKNLNNDGHYIIFECRIKLLHDMCHVVIGHERVHFWTSPQVLVSTEQGFKELGSPRTFFPVAWCKNTCYR